jgi:hypothetical protein
MTPTQSNEFEISIARYRRLAREVTDPLAACLLEVVIGDLEAGRVKAEEDDRNALRSGLLRRREDRDDALISDAVGSEDTALASPPST